MSDREGGGRPRLFAPEDRTTIGPVVDSVKVKRRIQVIADHWGVKPSVVVRSALRKGLREITREINEERAGGRG